MIESVTVKTNAPRNREVKVYFRVPKDYDARKPGLWRVLVLFGGRNTSGLEDVSGRLGWGRWADERGIFIVCPGFTNDDYWMPEAWSGRALMQALDAISKQYRICTAKLLYYGYSAGSQCSNLFPAWKPELARAWVSHACGVFHEPDVKMRGVPGLVTCGDADAARYVISRNFVEKSRSKGVDVIWKSFPNHPHDVPPGSLRLARAFLAYYHEAYISDLKNRYAGKAAPMKAVFIGDDQDNFYYPADSPQGANVLAEDRVPLPDREIADAWGRAWLPGESPEVPATR